MSEGEQQQTMLAFMHPEICEAFGMGSDAWFRIFTRHVLDPHVFATIHHDARGAVGFVILFPPDDPGGAWHFGYALPDPRHRDAFTAVATLDAMSAYVFEHMQLAEIAFWVREDNRAAQAVVRRVGYHEARVSRSTVRGVEKGYYVVPAALWQRRRARLQTPPSLHPLP